MASLPTLYPNIFKTQTGTTWTTTTVGNIDNGVSTPSGTFIVAGANSTSEIFYGITDMPSDFAVMTTLSYNIRYKIDSLAGDTETLYIQLYKADRTTPLTDEMTVTVRTATVALTNSGAISFTGVATTIGRYFWDGALIRIRTTHSANMGSDGSIWSIDEIELTGTYEQSPTVTLVTADAFDFGDDTTPTFEFSGSDPQGDDLEYEISIFNNFVSQSAGTQDWTYVAVNSSNGDVFGSVLGGDIYKQTGGTGAFVAQSAGTKNWRGVAVNSSNGDVFACAQNDDIYKQTGGTGVFTAQSAGAIFWIGVTVNPITNDVFGCASAGDVYKQTGGSGSFAAQSAGNLAWRGVAVNSTTNDVFAIENGGDIYKQTGGSGSFDAQSVDSLSWWGIAVNSSNGDVFACVTAGDIWKQTGGTGGFVAQNAGTRSWRGVAVNSSNGDVFSGVSSGDIYKQQNYLIKSSVTDSGFLNTVSGGDTHPFNQNEKISFTVQAGDNLNYGAYSWKVRAIDPLGENEWSSWSTTRTFSITETLSTVPSILIDGSWKQLYGGQIAINSTWKTIFSMQIAISGSWKNVVI